MWKRLAICLCVVMISSCVFSGCTLNEDSFSISRLTGKIQRFSDKDFSEIDDELLRKHFVSFLNAAYMRIQSSSSQHSNSTIVEFQPHGNAYSIHVKELDGISSVVFEYIRIGNDLYIKDFGDNVWWKGILKQGETDDELVKADRFTPEVVKTSIDAKRVLVTYSKLENALCGNRDCYTYKEIDSASKTTARTFWFDTKQLLLRREEIQFGDAIVTNEYTYDGISIVAPKATKEIEQGKSIIEYLAPDSYGTAGQNDSGMLRKLEEKQGE